MHKAYIIGTTEKHRVDISVNWLTLIIRVAVDKKTVFRRPLFFKFEHAFEVGKDDRHIVKVIFNVFDYYGQTLSILVDGQAPPDFMILRENVVKVDTPVDDAASALLFLVAVNVIFAVVGTLFPPDIDSLNNRLLLLLGGLIYLLIAVKVMLAQPLALILGISVFLVDSAYALFSHFALSGLLVRACVLYYLGMGFVSLHKKSKAPKVVEA